MSTEPSQVQFGAVSHCGGAATGEYAVPSPVVIEWFKNVRPTVGQEDTVYTRLLNHNKPVKGAHVIAILKLGKRVQPTVHATTTDAKGLTTATFKIPTGGAGRTLQVAVQLRYKRYVFIGENQVPVK